MPTMSKEKVPERIWLKIYGDSCLSATKFNPHEVHDNGKPVYEYVLDRPDIVPAGERVAKMAELLRGAFSIIHSEHKDYRMRPLPVSACRNNFCVAARELLDVKGEG